MRIAFALGLLGLLTVPASAATLQLELGGTAFEGNPAFEVSLDDLPIGAGSVDRLAGQDFWFQIPDAALNGANSQLTLRLTNDRFDGTGKDRNLYLISATLDGRTLELGSFRVLRDGVPVDKRLRSGHLEIWSGGEVAEGAIPRSSGSPAVSLRPGILESVPRCQSEVAIIGIASGAKTLSEKQLAVLNEFANGPGWGSCRIVVDGFASVGGSGAANARASTARAKLVAAALERLGATIAPADILGRGATSQFGKAAQDNQRVTVRTTPGGG